MEGLGSFVRRGGRCVVRREEVGVLYVEELGSFVRRGARCVVRRGARCFVRGGATVGWPTGARRAPLLLPVFTAEGRAGERPE